MLTMLTMLLSAPAEACLWDRDTLAIEQAGMPAVTAVLTGHFDRFPDAWYTARLDRSRATIAASPDDLSAHDDAAVALDRLGRQTEAIAMMEAKAEVLARTGANPEHRYRLLANQGTFYAHRFLTGSDSPSDLAQAIALIEAAIALNPDAHFGREVVQLKALYWLRDAPMLDWVTDLWRQPGLLGFEDWKRTTVQAVSADHIDLEMARIVEGLTGLIVLGAAWESPDIHFALVRALQASGQSHLAWMARLRVVELLESGKTFHQPHHFSHDILRNTVLDTAFQAIETPELVEAEFSAARAEAEKWHTQRTAWITAQLDAGEHPDTHADFWDGAP